MLFIKMYFAEYFRTNNKESGLCGSDSILPLDGRLSLDNKVSIVRDNFYQKRYLRNNAKYFRIAYGSILKPNYITDFIKL